MIQHSDLKYLSVDLPGDLRRLKDAGDFTRLEKVIKMRIGSGKLNEAMIKRLELENAMNALVKNAYPYDEDRALEIMRERIEGATMEELESYRDLDAADWIYIDGKVMFRANFMNNLMKTRADVLARAKDPKEIEEAKNDDEFLDSIIAKQKEKGELAYRFRIKAGLSVDEEYFEEGKKLTVHIPVPIEGAQIEDVKIISINPEPKNIAQKDYPQRTVCFEGVYDKDQKFEVEYEFTNRAKYVKPDPEKVMASQPTFYLEEVPPHIMFKPYIKALTEQVVGDTQNPLVKAKKIYDYITSVPIYSFMPPYFTIEDLPGFMATRLKGDCGIFALFFITMCRCAGVPAKWQSGLYTNPHGVGNHDWAQFYVAPYGWLFADCSFGSSATRKHNAVRNDFYFGNLEPFRMVAASEFQHEFYPPMKFMRYDPYDNQDGEAEYEDTGLAHSKITTWQDIISAEEID